MENNNLSSKKIFITSFAIFSMLFGGGNFILPPLLGIKAADHWAIVCLAFGISAVLIPFLGIYIQAKQQATMIEIGSKIHPFFGLLLGIVMYSICLFFPVPRTASVTYELAIENYLPMSSFWFSVIYFSLVLYLCFNRNKILDVIGKYLTPILLTIILLIIFKAIFFVDNAITPSTLVNPFRSGLLEGYQTFDGIASIIIGGVISASLNMDKTLSFVEKQRLTIYAGIISCIVLFSIYTGFIYTGALLAEEFTLNASRAEVLSGISYHTLGNIGQILLNISVSIACFTTAVGIIVGSADFMKYIFKNSNLAYNLTVIISCVLGVIIGQTGTENIIKIAVPTLVMTYPIIIMLIFLNIVPNTWTSKLIFRLVIATCILFALPDFLATLGIDTYDINKNLPLADYNFSWFLPSAIMWILVAVFQILFIKKSL